MTGLGAGQAPSLSIALSLLAQSPLVSGVLTPSICHSGFWFLNLLVLPGTFILGTREDSSRLASPRGQLLFMRLLSRVARVMLGHAPCQVHSFSTFKLDGVFVLFCFGSCCASPSGVASVQETHQGVSSFPGPNGVPVPSGSNCLCRIY